MANPRQGRGPVNGSDRGGQFGGGRRSSGRAGNDTSAQSIAPPPNRLDMVDATFRSVYLPQARNETPRSLDVFDVADSNAVVGSRSTSNTADQALYVLNNPFVLAQAKAFALRTMSEAKPQTERIRLAFMLAYGRPPRPSEMRAAINLLDDMNHGGMGLQLLCQSLLASAEFRYVY